MSVRILVKILFSRIFCIKLVIGGFFIDHEHEDESSLFSKSMKAHPIWLPDFWLKKFLACFYLKFITRGIFWVNHHESKAFQHLQYGSSNSRWRIQHGRLIFGSHVFQRTICVKFITLTVYQVADHESRVELLGASNPLWRIQYGRPFFCKNLFRSIFLAQNLFQSGDFTVYYQDSKIMFDIF